MHIHKTLGDFRTNHIEIYLGFTKPLHTIFDIGFNLTKTRVNGHFTILGLNASYNVYWALGRMNKALFLAVALIAVLGACKDEELITEKVSNDSCNVAVTKEGCWVGPISSNNSIRSSYVELEGDNRRIFFSPYITVGEAPSCKEAAKLVGTDIKKCKWIGRKESEDE